MLNHGVHFLCSITISERGEQNPGFGFYKENLTSLNYLSGQIEFVFSKNVKELIDNVKRVMEGQIKKYFVGCEDMLDVDIYKHETKTSEYNKYWPDNKVEENEFPTIDFLDFLEHWYAFLLRYENNEIPNLKYAFKSEGIVIPPHLPDNEIE
jgi:hypothetical protein